MVILDAGLMGVPYTKRFVIGFDREGTGQFMPVEFLNDGQHEGCKSKLAWQTNMTAI